MRRGNIEIRAIKGRTVRITKVVHLHPKSLREKLPHKYPRYSAMRVSWNVELLGLDTWFPFFEDPGHGEEVPDYREVERFDEMFKTATSLLVEQKEQS